MSRRLIPVALLGVLVLASSTSALASSTTQTGSTAESENPINDQGSNYNYRSEITSISPKVQGLGIEVLEFADRLVLTNHTGKTVTVYGYSGEPYARVQADGTTEQNVRSPAVYLNTNFYGNVTVPTSASASDPPKWVVVDRSGSFEWHDHRIHWMSPVTPPQVKDKGKRTLIFHWSVPISVGAQKGVVDGQLFWVPESSKAPVAAIVALVAILLLALVFVVVVRRHRGGLTPTNPGAEESEGASGSKEAW
ncbi:MAG TPA: hypothetical protein VIJ39_13445 [Solirubrobacteraceae bacterium]